MWINKKTKNNRNRLVALNQGLQIFDLLDISRLENECRRTCRRALRDFFLWRTARARAVHNVADFYAEAKGIMLRRQAEETLALYRDIRRERQVAFAAYINKLPHTQKMMVSNNDDALQNPLKSVA